MSILATFNSVNTSTPSTYSGQAILRINQSTRSIEVPENLTLGVQDDDRSNTVFFNIDQYISGKDITTATLTIEYINANGNADGYLVPAKDIANNNGFVTFSWVLDEKVTAKSGVIQFALKVVFADGTVWNTTPSDAVVLTGITITDGMTEEEINLINDLIRSFNEAAQNLNNPPKIEDNRWFIYDATTEEYVDSGVSANGEAGPEGPQGPDGPQGPAGENGATFTPSISGGVLSWSNDKSLSNPDSYDIGAELNTLVEQQLGVVLSGEY